MARTVSVQMELDDEGVVQSVKAQGVAFEEAAEAADDLSQSMERQEAAARESGDASEQAAQGAREQGEASERAAQGAREQAAAQERVASTSTTMSSNVSGSANALGFELVQASQDAKFGLVGVANQIPLMSEQFSRLQSQTGSTTGAMGALFSALKGPAGIIGAFTLLLTFKDEIVGFFESVGGEAETAAAGIEKVKGQLEETLDLGDLGELGTDTDAIRQEVGRLEEGLQQLQEERSRLAEESETAVERAALSAQASLAEFLRSQGMSAEMVEQLGAAEGEAAERASDAVTRQDELDAAISQVNTRLRVLRGRLRAIDAVEEVAPGLLKEEETAATEENLDSINQLLQETIRSMSELPEGELISGQMPDLRKELDLAALATDLQDIQDLMDAGMLKSIGSVNAALGSLDTMLANATSQEKRNRIRALIRELEALRSEMRGASQESLRLGDTLERGLAEAITSAATAIGKGESVAEALLMTLASLAQRVGKMMIAFGTSMLALETIVSNPVGAIAAGSALVALGAAAKEAIQEEFATTTSGGAGRQRSTQLEGGGEAGVDLPGRAQGGPIQPGQPYLVGEDGPEVVVPGSKGFVFSNEALQAATSSRSRTVNVRAEGQFGVEDLNIETDLFKLSARLSEVQRVLDRVARQ